MSNQDARTFPLALPALPSHAAAIVACLGGANRGIIVRSRLKSSVGSACASVLATHLLGWTREDVLNCTDVGSLAQGRFSTVEVWLHSTQVAGALEATLRGSGIRAVPASTIISEEESAPDVYLVAGSPTSLNTPASKRRLVYITGDVSAPRAAESLGRAPNARLEKPLECNELRSMIRKLVRELYDPQGALPD